MNYPLLKLLHVAAVIVFLGNIITGHFWMHLAMKSKDLNILRHSIKGVTQSDKVFTMPAVVVIVLAGILAAYLGNIPVLRTGWILWSIVMFSLSGGIFSAKLSVILRKMHETINDSNDLDSKWTSIERQYTQWNMWALTAIILPIAALVMMILKIPA